MQTSELKVSRLVSSPRTNSTCRFYIAKPQPEGRHLYIAANHSVEGPPHFWVTDINQAHHFVTLDALVTRFRLLRLLHPEEFADAIFITE